MIFAAAYCTANEGPVRIPPIYMSGSHLCVPRNETVHSAASLFPKQNYNVLSQFLH
jgi:hypothetical protein